MPMDHPQLLLADNRRLTPEKAAWLESILSPDEQRRARKYRDPDSHLNFLIGRGLVRLWLARELEENVDTVEIRLTASGKPQAFVDACPVAYSFSISHTRQWVAVAFWHSPIGIDLQYPVMEDKMKIARRYFSQDEVSWLESRSDDERQMAFNQLWVLKEAEVKRLGSSLARQMGQAIFQIEPQPSGLLIKAPAEHCAAQNARYTILKLPTGLWFAIALDRYRQIFTTSAFGFVESCSEFLVQPDVLKHYADSVTDFDAEGSGEPRQKPASLGR